MASSMNKPFQTSYRIRWLMSLLYNLSWVSDASSSDSDTLYLRKQQLVRYSRSKSVMKKQQNDTIFITTALNPNPKTLWYFPEFFYIFPRIQRYFYALFLKNRRFSIYAAEI